MEIRKLSKEEKGKQAELTRMLMKASEAYYGTGVSEVADIEFDKLQEELKILETNAGFAYEGSPNVSIGASAVTALQKARHVKEAQSLGKVKYKDRKDLAEWLENADGKSIDGVLSWKMDGLTLVNTYENGSLISSVTRGDGVEGSVVTHNALFFKGLPLHIPYKGRLVVRGEAVMTYAEFDRINTEAGGIYENPRNLAAATVQMLSAEESRKREIQFYAFKLAEPEPGSHPDIPSDAGVYDLAKEGQRFRFMMEQGIQVVPHTYVSAGDVLDKIDEFQNKIAQNPFPTDGLVLSYDDQIYAESLGSTEHHPRGSIAMKWTDETAPTIIRDIYWSVGKTGQITPVAVFDPVRLGAGSTVTRASLHNISIMQSLPETKNSSSHLSLQIGAQAEVYLANMIIPQIASVSKGDTDIIIPKVCPVCGAPTVFRENKNVKTLHCENFRCPARTRGMLENAFCKDGLFVKGLGPSQIEDLQHAGMLTVYPAEIFTLKRRFGKALPVKLKKLEGWGEKSWTKLLDAIDAARKTSMKHFLYSLGVPMLGKDLSKKLDKFWNGNIEKFKDFLHDPDTQMLTNLEGVGAVKAGYLVDWCNETTHDAMQNLMLNMLMDELVFEKTSQAAETDSNTLSGLTFVITGSVNHYRNRDEFKASVEARGGKVSGSVSKNTDYLVNNDAASTSGKNRKALELGIPVISEDEFIRKFGK